MVAIHNRNYSPNLFVGNQDNQRAQLLCQTSIYLPYKSFFLSPLGGANNPFLQNASYAADGSRIEGDPAQGQYYGAGYSQAQSGYSSSGFGK